jgi:hypothetical protein
MSDWRSGAAGGISGEYGSDDTGPREHRHQPLLTGDMRASELAGEKCEMDSLAVPGFPPLCHKKDRMCVGSLQHAGN